MDEHSSSIKYLVELAKILVPAVLAIAGTHQWDVSSFKQERTAASSTQEEVTRTLIGVIETQSAQLQECRNE